MKLQKTVVFLALVAFLFTASRLNAGIVYDGETNSIIVDNYAEDMPCALEEIYIADRMNGWNKVTRDEKSGAYTIDAALVVGRDNGTDTYMQIGTPENPKETLLLKGHLVIHPFVFIDEKDAETREKRINRLTIGDKDNPDIKPTVKLAGTGIFVGCTPPRGKHVKRRRGAGGELHIYNSAIRGAGESWPDQAAGQCDLLGWKCAFRAADAVFSNFKDIVVRKHSAYTPCSIKRCAFEDSGRALYADRNTFKKNGLLPKECAFRGIRKAALSGGGWFEADRCTFENNRVNWDLSHGGDVKCFDCIVHASAQDNLYGVYLNPRTKKQEPASFLSQRHVIVRVLDANGKPVEGAEVVASSEAPDHVCEDKAVTDTNGLTPGPDNDGALLLTTTTVAAIKQGEALRTDYSYSIRVRYRDRTGICKGFKPSKSWEIVTITLDKESK